MLSTKKEKAEEETSRSVTFGEVLVKEDHFRLPKAEDYHPMPSPILRTGSRLLNEERAERMAAEALLLAKRRYEEAMQLLANRITEQDLIDLFYPTDKGRPKCRQ